MSAMRIGLVAGLVGARPHHETFAPPGSAGKLGAEPSLLHDDAALAGGRAAQAAARALVALLGALTGAVAAARREGAVGITGAVVAGVLGGAHITLLGAVAHGIAAERSRLAVIA